MGNRLRVTWMRSCGQSCGWRLRLGSCSRPSAGGVLIFRTFVCRTLIVTWSFFAVTSVTICKWPERLLRARRHRRSGTPSLSRGMFCFSMSLNYVSGQSRRLIVMVFHSGISCMRPHATG
ncbi:unnamed protein product [Symbiodinium sp. CCMP2456]|nr:unnamed protein product [Symbiodinium sp. CCMP2456]